MIKRIFKNYKAILFLIVVLSIILRFYGLDRIPASLNPDEASLGYNSYAILNTGADEHGSFLPLSLKSFGDWKLPAYPFFSTLPILLFGLSDFSTRFISALSGVIGTLLIYFIALKLFNKKSLALISSLFFALSPWNIYFSRAAYEVNLATVLFLAGLYAFFKYLDSGKRKLTWIVLSCVFFGITVFTYNSFIVFVPLFISGLFFVFKEKIKLDAKFLIPIIVFFLFSLFGFYSSIFTSTDKTSSLLFFNDPNVIYNRVEKIRGDGDFDNPVDKFIFNKFTGGAYQFGQNYLSAFTPEFLFDKGGEKLVDNLGYFGNIYLIDSLFILAGIIGMALKKERSFKLLLIWLLLAPIPAALTKNPLSSTRLYTLMPLLVIISSYGAWFIIDYLRKPTFTNNVIKLFIFVLFIYNVALFIDGYFVHLNNQRARFWRYGYKQAVELTQKYPDYKVVFRGPENFPYIYFLFYNKYDPLKFKQEVEYYPPTNEGFLYVKNFDRYSFVDRIDYSELEENTIYIDDTMLGDEKNSIKLPSGEPILGYLIKGK